MIVTSQNRLALLGTIYWGIRNLTHKFHKGTTMVNLIMIHHYIVNLMNVNHLFQSAYKLSVIRQPNSIHKNRFLILNKIAVITASVKS